MPLFDLVTLAGGAGAHIVEDDSATIGDVEVDVEMVECLLNALVAHTMGGRQDGLQRWRGGWQKDTCRT